MGADDGEAVQARLRDVVAAAVPDPHGGVDIDLSDDVVRVRFWGSVDLAVREATGSARLAELRRGGLPMTVDCREVTFMDSTGLSVLVRLVRDAAADGRPVRFLGASRQVDGLLRATGVDVWMSGLGVQADG